MTTPYPHTGRLMFRIALTPPTIDHDARFERLRLWRDLNNDVYFMRAA